MNKFVQFFSTEADTPGTGIVDIKLQLSPGARARLSDQAGRRHGINTVDR